MTDTLTPHLVPPLPPLPNVVALVGCDGTGKSTLVHDLVRRLGAERPTVRRYMGLVSGESGDKIKALPVIGPALERYLAAKARRAQDMDQKLPGTFTALVMYAFSIWRVFQLGRLERLARSGVLVIADRYPQAEVPGFNYDGPGLSTERARSRLARTLAIREQQLYDRMARLRPSLVIRLMIDAETAHTRKPDHPIEELRDKIAIMPRIGYAGAAVVEIDTRRPYPEVLDEALAAVRRAIPAPDAGR
jgi:thymidylate kinase